MSEFPTDMDNLETGDASSVGFPMDLSVNNNVTEPQVFDSNTLRSSVIVLSPIATGPMLMEYPWFLDPNSIAAQQEAMRSNAAVAPVSAYQPSHYNDLLCLNYNPYHEAAAATQYHREQQQMHIQHAQQQQVQMQLQQQIDFNAMMHAQSTAGPLYGGTMSVSPQQRYPYFNGFGGSGGSVGVMDNYGHDVNGIRPADNRLPEPTGVTAEELEAYHVSAVHKKYCEIVQQLDAFLVALNWLEADNSVTDLDPEPEEIAAIYKRREFLIFRQRQLNKRGQARKTEKLHQSMANMKIGDGGGQQSSDQKNAAKRQKHNEAAKKLREARRQKSMENEICVLYLNIKMAEMEEIKKRLMLEMVR